jgi:hypothetical protein
MVASSFESPTAMAQQVYSNLHWHRLWKYSKVWLLKTAGAGAQILQCFTSIELLWIAVGCFVGLLSHQMTQYGVPLVDHMWIQLPHKTCHALLAILKMFLQLTNNGHLLFWVFSVHWQCYRSKLYSECMQFAYSI